MNLKLPLKFDVCTIAGIIGGSITYLPLKTGDIVKISNYAQQTTEARIRIYGVLS